MTSQQTKKFLFIVVFFTLTSGIPYAQVRLPRLIRDSMILQRDTRIKIWGWATKDEKVRIQFLGKKHRATATADGTWSMWLPPVKAGGPYTMTISGTNRITIKNILAGDVWLCAGQSNMVHQMELHSVTYADDIAKANYPEIRHFKVPATTNLRYPQDDLPSGYWLYASPGNVRQFSAVAYFFARAIYEKYHVPIGLINASVGGTPVEAWTGEDGLKEFPALRNSILQNKDSTYTDSLKKMSIANDTYYPGLADKGRAGPKPWYDTAYMPKGWHTINIPGYWEDQGVKDLDGVVWFRREIDVPAAMTGIPGMIVFGRVVNADSFFVNGTYAGSTTYQYPQRRYPLPAGLLKAGKNILVIRVVNTEAKGGFVPDKPYYLTAGGQSIDLKGYWQYKVGDVFPAHANRNKVFSFQNQPAALYNGMIAPLTNYTIRGFAWYQGEANTAEAGQYAKHMAAMIADWRAKWKLGSLPFVYVQLPGFMEMNYLPSESRWAELREAQLKTLSVPNTGMAVAIDLGEWNDIHPDNKKDVGTRLALAAEKLSYGEKDLVFSGPVYHSSVIANNKIILTFSNTGGGLIASNGEELSQFAIAAADKKFLWAKARIDGYKVIVWNEDIPHPAYVRYAWADNPDGANLFNKEGLPASPFRTDEP